MDYSRALLLSEYVFRAVLYGDLQLESGDLHRARPDRGGDQGTKNHEPQRKTGMTGVELVTTVSKAVALPLHHIPLFKKGPLFWRPFTLPEKVGFEFYANRFRCLLHMDRVYGRVRIADPAEEWGASADAEKDLADGMIRQVHHGD